MKLKANEQQRVAIYCRVSKDTQDLSMQENELKEFTSRRGWVIHRIYRDHGESGANRSRPALDELLEDCRRRRFDILAIWKLDRLARNLRQLLDIVELCKSIGVQFLSLTDGIDTSTAAGTFVFHLFAALSEMERGLIRERTIAGIREARRRGKKLGRPAAAPLLPEQIAAIRKERSENKVSLRKLVRQHGIPLWRVHAVCREAKPSV